MRLGFPGRVYGLGIAGTDEESDLGKWLAHLSDLVRYLTKHQIRLYRPIFPDFSSAAVYESELLDQSAFVALLAQEIANADIRLTAHMPLTLVLSTADDAQADATADWLTWASHLLSLLTPGNDGLLVAHFGGIYADKEAAIAAFCKRYEALPERVRGMLCLENDDHGLSFAEVMCIHQRVGVPIVLDNLHFCVNNPERMPLATALEQAMASWPLDKVPKVHYCDPRTEARGLGRGRVKLPTWTEHSDFVNPFALIDFAQRLANLGPVDIMLEAKARDLAWLKLRDDLMRYAPALNGMFAG